MWHMVIINNGDRPMMPNDFDGLHFLSDDALRAIIRGVRANPPKNWPKCVRYDTQLSYEACLLLGRRVTWDFGQKEA